MHAAWAHTRTLIQRAKTPSERQSEFARLPFYFRRMALILAAFRFMCVCVCLFALSSALCVSALASSVERHFLQSCTCTLPILAFHFVHGSFIIVFYLSFAWSLPQSANQWQSVVMFSRCIHRRTTRHSRPTNFNKR